MKLHIREHLFENVSSRTFYRILAELINRDDRLKDADDYIQNFDKSKKRDYVNQYPIKDIKNDLYVFVKDWANKVQSIDGIYKVDRVWRSGSYGFSNYIQISFDRPKDRRLFDFYNSNKNLYQGVKFRFSEHESKNDASDIEDNVNFIGKTFDQAADEMKFKIENYIVDLRSKEKQYLKKLDKQSKKRW